MTTEVCLARIEAALADADATLSTGLGDHQELTCARLWRGQVLVDWEPDPLAGGCLLRPALLRRLIALRARVEERMDGLVIHAPGRIVTALSPQHAGLVRQLGGAPRVELSARLRIEDDQYVGGDETYWWVERGKRLPLLKLRAEVRVREGRDVRGT